MTDREILSAADGVFDADRSLRRAADTVGDLADVASAALRVLDDAAFDTFYAHQEDRRDLYIESAGEQLDRLRARAGVIRELGEDLEQHLSAASFALTRSREELGGRPDEHDPEVRLLRVQLDTLGEVVALAQPLAEQITRHAQKATESAAATDALMLLDSEAHDSGREVVRADEGVAVMRSMIDAAHSRSRDMASLAGALTNPTPPPATNPPPAHGVAI